MNWKPVGYNFVCAHIRTFLVYAYIYKLIVSFIHPLWGSIAISFTPLQTTTPRHNTTTSSIIFFSSSLCSQFLLGWIQWVDRMHAHMHMSQRAHMNTKAIVCMHVCLWMREHGRCAWYAISSELPTDRSLLSYAALSHLQLAAASIGVYEHVLSLCLFLCFAHSITIKKSESIMLLQSYLIILHEMNKKKPQLNIVRMSGHKANQNQIFHSPK